MAREPLRVTLAAPAGMGKTKSSWVCSRWRVTVVVTWQEPSAATVRKLSTWEAELAAAAGNARNKISTAPSIIRMKPFICPLLSRFF